MSRFLALDGDHPQIQVVTATVRHGKVRLERACVLSEEHPINLANAEALGHQLREQLKAAGIKPAPVLACVGRERVILKEVKHPAVGAVEEAALIRFQALKELTDSPDDIVIDYVGGTGPAGQERMSLAVAVRKELLGAYRKLCEAAGLKLVALTPRPFGAAAAVAALSTEPPAAGSTFAVLTRGERWGEFAVIQDGKLLMARSFGGPALATDTAMVGEVHRNLAVWSGQHPRQQIDALYVAEAPGLTDLASRLSEALGVAVHGFDPLTGAADAPDGPRGAFAGAVGLLHLYAAAKKGELPVNFEKPREPKPPPDPNRRPMIAAAAVLLLLVFGGAAWGLSQRFKLDSQIAGLQKKKTEMDELADKMTKEAKRGTEIDAWMNQEVVWLDELYDLVDRFPRDRKDSEQPSGQLRLTRLDVTTLAAPPSTTRNNGTAGATAAKARPVAKLVLEGLTTAGPEPVNGIESEFVIDQHYNTKSNLVVPAKRTEQRLMGSSRTQVFTLTIEVEPAVPERYTRHFQATPPRRGFGGDDGAGGGMFGGNVFGGGAP